LSPLSLISASVEVIDVELAIADVVAGSGGVIGVVDKDVVGDVGGAGALTVIGGDDIAVLAGDCEDANTSFS
jgi:hypothetical protein